MTVTEALEHEERVYRPHTSVNALIPLYPECICVQAASE